MSIYALLKFIHVLLAITALGTNITYGLWLPRAAREPHHLEFALKGVKLLDDRLANPAYGLLLITGLAMLYLGKLDWTTPWLLTALVLYVLVLGLGLRGFTPLLRRQIAVLQAGTPESPEYRRLAARSRTVGILLSVIVLLIVFLMVTKPRLWG